MWRSLIAAAIVYTSGHPCLDGYRPGLLDRPLQTFYLEVNKAAHNGKAVLSNFDETRCIGYLKAYIDRVDAQLRGKG
jgi:hypothetical protein